MTYPDTPRNEAENSRYNTAFDQDWLEVTAWGGELSPTAKAKQIVANARAAQRGAHGRPEQPPGPVRGDGPGDGDAPAGLGGVRRNHRGEARFRHPEIRPGVVEAPRHDQRAAHGAGGHVQLPVPGLAGDDGTGGRPEPSPVVHADRAGVPPDRSGVVHPVGDADETVGDPGWARGAAVSFRREPGGRAADGEPHR